MRLSLKTKFTLATSLLVLGVVAVVSGLYLGRLTQQVLRQADDRARFVAQQVFLACQNAFADAAEHGESPASADPQALREYVQSTLDGSSTLNSLIESAVGYSPTIYEITISDSDGVVMVSSDASLRGQKVAARPSVTSLVRDSFFRQLRALYGPPQTYEFSLPFNLGSGPFGQIRIELSSTLLRDEISPQLDLGRILGAWLGAVINFAGVFREPNLAGSYRTNLRAIGPHFRRAIRSRTGRAAKRRAGRGEHENHRHRKTIARRARNFQHAARKPRSGDERDRGRADTFQRAKAEPCW